jgi:hypothetical protein
MSDAFEFVIDGTSWKVSAMRGREAVSEPFSFEVVAFADGAAPLASAPRRSSHGRLKTAGSAPLRRWSTALKSGLVETRLRARL